MVHVTRVLLLSAVIPLITASQADACWLCWKSHHSSHYASTHGGAGGGASGGEAGAGGGLAVNTESGARPEAGKLTPKQESPKADGKDAPQKEQPTPSSDIGGRLDKMSAQLDRMEAKLNSPESAAAGTQESAIATVIFQRLAGKVLENVLDDFENRLGGLAAAPVVQPVVSPVDHDAEAKKAFISLLSDPEVKKALKEAIK